MSHDRTIAAGAAAIPGSEAAQRSSRERVIASLRELARVAVAAAATTAGGVAAAQVDDPVAPPPVEPFVALVSPGVVAAIGAAIAAWGGRVPWRRTFRVTTSLLVLLAVALAIAAVVKTGHWDPYRFAQYGPERCLVGADCFRLFATSSAVVAGVNIVLAWVARGEPRRGYWTLVVAGSALTVMTVVLLAALVQHVLEHPWYPFAHDLAIVIPPALVGVPMLVIGVRYLRRRGARALLP